MSNYKHLTPLQRSRIATEAANRVSHDCLCDAAYRLVMCGKYVKRLTVKEQLAIVGNGDDEQAVRILGFDPAPAADELSVDPKKAR